MYYTTWGPERGCCGHLHRTIEAAEKCIDQDAHARMLAGDSTDREIRIVWSRKELETCDPIKGPGVRLPGEPPATAMAASVEADDRIPKSIYKSVYISDRRWRQLSCGLRQGLSKALGGHRIRKHHVATVQAKLRAAGQPDLANRLGEESERVMAQEWEARKRQRAAKK